MTKKLNEGSVAPNFSFLTPWAEEKNDFYNLAKGKTKVILFLRYYGCLICQLDIKTLRDQIALFKEKNIEVFLVIQSSRETISNNTHVEDWPFHIVCDPESSIYKKYLVNAGNIIQFMHPAGLLKLIKALSKGHKHGKFEGKETQLPAVFGINSKNEIIYAHYGKHISDIPNNSTIINSIA